jgi:molybdopterin-guanine dinucleotide biosynthesis protein B
MEVLVTSSRRWVVMHELRGAPEPTLDEHVQRMAPCDLVLVEGFKRENFPKIEVYRAANGKPLLHGEDRHIVAVASDAPLPGVSLPVIDLNDIGAVANALLHYAVPMAEIR